MPSSLRPSASLELLFNSLVQLTRIIAKFERCERLLLDVIAKFHAYHTAPHGA
jgi:hypothetical protein